VKGGQHTRTRTLLQYGIFERAREMAAEDRAAGDLILDLSQSTAALPTAAAVTLRNKVAMRRLAR
jgi:hypothetical protein